MESVNVLTLRRKLTEGQPAPEILAANHWLDDLKLFGAAWIGGLVFFSTYLA